jgi:cephalosporin-C deacetylase-like acetyl esterase
LTTGSGKEYQGMVMKSSLLAASCLLVPFFSAHLAPAQAPAPPQGAAVPAARAANPANAGRERLDQYLDGLVAADLQKRAASVAQIHTRAQAEARQAMVRREILALLGPLPPRTPLHARTTGETQADGFTIRKVLFESQPDFPVTALLYLPSGQTAGGKRPAILLTPGHSANGKTSDAGTAAILALNGFVVLSYDPIGQGERLQYPDASKPGTSLASRATGEHGEASLQPMLIGDTFARYVLWDSMRGIDYLSDLPEVDPHRIAALGCSGGGAMTALVGALDPRLAAVGVACYTTSFDTLLPTLGPQDAEQSNPRFISSGFGFPDWIELAAPRPYAVIATYSDMFPFAGARSTVIEARRFYALFDPASAGVPVSGEPPSVPPTPTEPALNPDTTNEISPLARLQFITGPGGHGALRPIMGNIVSFFIRNLEPAADARHPVIPPGYLAFGAGNPIFKLPKDTFQVTSTGQVATSFPHCATVFTLNRARAARLIAAHRQPLSRPALEAAIRQVTGAMAMPGTEKFDGALLAASSGPIAIPSDGLDLEASLAVPEGPGRHRAILFLVPSSIDGDTPIARANKAKFDALAAQGKVVLALTPRPSPPGTDDMKSPLLGPFYLLSLRADLVGRTLVGLRVDDAIRAVDYLAGRADVDPAQISAAGSGHMGLVLLHAAVLDHRLRHIDIDHVLSSYQSLLSAPLPTGAPEDILPGVALHYDLPDLARALGSRLTETDPLPGTADLSQTSTPLSTLEHAQP